ncbi:MAG: signal peptidase I [Deltaproteobacteria bacterium]|nr:signal peptidase I [Deltaproteobacteria bacterium]
MSRLRRFRTAVMPLAIIVLTMLTVRASLADHVRVPTGSMQPTVAIGDRVIVNKAAYGVRVPGTQVWLARFAGPAVGDVVVLDAPDEDKLLLKRVVAGPGDTIAVHRGEITLNGVAQPITTVGALAFETLNGRAHPVRLDRQGGPDYGPETLPAGRYLVMGDNRGDSRDGRYFGLISRDAILGRAALVFMRQGSPTWRGL